MFRFGEVERARLKSREAPCRDMACHVRRDT